MPEILRILAVGNMYPPHHQGGYEIAWHSTMELARSEGHAVRVLASTHRDPHVDVGDDPGVYRTLRWYWDWERHAFPRLPLRERLALERANAAELSRHLSEFNPDVVMWWSMGHMSLSLLEQVRRRGIPAVVSVHNDWLVYAWKADQWIRIWRDRPSFLGDFASGLTRIPTRVDVHRCGRLLFNSAYTLRRAAEAGIDTSDSAIIYPGIRPSFLQALPSQRWGWRLLYVGRIDRFKGVDTAIEALRYLPEETSMSIHGKGDPAYAAELRHQARALGLQSRVTFGDFLGPDEVVQAYRAADVVVFPVRGEEPWGLVPLEAMGLGRLVVSTARGGTAEFVRDSENSLVIVPDDARVLASAIHRLADDPDLRARLIAGGRQTAESHTAAEFDRMTLHETVDAVLGARARTGTHAPRRWSGPGSGEAPPR